MSRPATENRYSVALMLSFFWSLKRKRTRNMSVSLTCSSPPVPALQHLFQELLVAADVRPIRT